jgi:hypothetical protein
MRRFTRYNTQMHTSQVLEAESKEKHGESETLCRS